MSARSFKARATAGGATAYAKFFHDTLVPQLREIAGHRGALVLTRDAGDAVEIDVVTFWDSMDAVRRFAGDTPERAVVEPEARAILSWFDERVLHHDVVVRTSS